MRRTFPSPRIVQPAEPRTRALVLTLLVSIIGVALAFAFYLGRLQAGALAMEKQRKADDWQQQLAVVSDRNAKLQREIEMLRGGREINLGTIEGLRAEVASLQDKQLEQEEELAVLRSVLGNGGVKGALKIHDFELRAAETEGRYSYKFTVSQMYKEFGIASGEIKISVLGELDGKPAALGLVDISEEKAQTLKMRFRYFQNVTGDIVLPAGFQPESFKIDVKPKSEGLAPVSRTFSWPKSRA